MTIVTNIKEQPLQRFVYAGNVYALKGDTLYKEVYFNEGNQLNGFFKKIFKAVGKIVKSPILGIALTAATGGAFGILSASQLMAVNVAKGITGFSGLINTRNDLKKQQKADAANSAYYDQQVALVDAQIKAAGGQVPVDGALPVAANAEGTKAIQAYAAYIAAGGDPSKFSLNTGAAQLPNVTSFGGISPSLLIAGGVGLIGVILIATNVGRK